MNKNESTVTITFERHKELLAAEKAMKEEMITLRNVYVVGYGISQESCSYIGKDDGIEKTIVFCNERIKESEREVSEKNMRINTTEASLATEKFKYEYAGFFARLRYAFTGIMK